MPSFVLIRSCLALLLAFALVACGEAAEVTGGGDPAVAATVNDTDIPIAEVETRFEQAKTQPQVQQQLEADTEGALEAQIQAQILSQLVLSEILEQWGDELGIAVTDEDIEAQREELIEQLGGQEAFDQAVAESGLSDEDIQLQLRQRALQAKIAEEVGTDAEVTDEEIEAFYEQNAETRYAGLARARHILVEDKALAEDLLEQIEEGADFAELAKEHSTDPGSGAKGGDLGEFGPGQMVPEFDEAVFSAQEGDVLGPIKTQFGFHIIEVLELTEGQELDEVREEIRAELEETKQGEQLQTELTDRTKAAEVTVNPRFGKWNAETGQVEPAQPLGAQSETTGSEGAVPPGTEGAVPPPTEGSAPQESVPSDAPTAPATE